MGSGLPISPLFIVIMAAVVVCGILAPQIKGFAGELVIRIMLRGLSREKYTVINDLMLKTGTMTAQIDHVIVSDYGIFVIETKNYSGKIYGDEDGAKWTQRFPRKEFQFMNPVIQNQGHIKAIRSHLSGFEDVPYIPIIVFMNRAVLRVRTKTAVINAFWLWWVIRKHKTVSIAPDAKTEIVRYLTVANITDPELRRQHIKNVKRNIRGNKKTYRATSYTGGTICPKCSGNLIRRNGWGNTFLGCSNYPRCRYTRNA